MKLSIPMNLLNELKVGQKLIIDDKTNKAWIQDTGTSQQLSTSTHVLDLSTALSICKQVRATLEKRISGLGLAKQLKVRSGSK